MQSASYRGKEKRSQFRDQRQTTSTQKSAYKSASQHTTLNQINYSPNLYHLH